MNKKTFYLLILALSLIACTDNTAGEKNDENNDNLYQYKSAYVGDNSKVSSIVNLQPYPKNLKPAGIEILSQSTPYGLRVFLTGYDIAGVDLFKNAIATFSLIDNLDSIDYVDKNSNQTIVQYHRDDSENQLKQSVNKTIDDISANAESLDIYLNQIK